MIRRIQITAIALALCLSGAVAVAAQPRRSPAGPPSGDYQLVWSDEFDGEKNTAPDSDKWVEQDPGKRRDAVNVPEAAQLDGRGHLVIKTWSQGAGQDRQHFTGMVSTRGKFEQTFGYWEARIDFDTRPGMWSAFWVMSPQMGKHPGDPEKSGIEIDVIEHRVFNAQQKNIADIAQFAVHWDGYGASHKNKGKEVKAPNLQRGFHIFALEWTPTELIFYVDGKERWRFNEAASHRPQYVILSSEVKDKGWAGDVPKRGYGDKATSKTRMVVDYVRVYAKKKKDPNESPPSVEKSSK